MRLATRLKAIEQAARKGFTLVEVVLAVGILSLAIMALFGMFAPTMGAVRNVVEGDFAIASTGAVNNYLQDQMTFGAVQTGIQSGAFSLYLYRVDNSGVESTKVVNDIDAFNTDRDAGNVSSGVIRVDIKQLPTGYPNISDDPSDYTTGTINAETHIAMIVEMWSVNASNPGVGGREVFTYTTAVLR